MKKLLAFLLSALLLCSALPFANVFAADEATIVVSQLEANAGDEIEVVVQLLNNPGIVSAKIEILYDESVMELVSYYDEDEEDYFNQIEPAKGWSSKYITYGPVGDCLMNFCNGTAKKNVTVEDFFTATFIIKEDAVSGTYPLTIKYDPADFFDMDLARVEFTSIDGYVVINGSDPVVPPSCEHEYDNACDVDCNLCGEVRETSHSYIADVTAPDCVNGGYTTYTCACGDSYIADNTAALGHTYDDDFDADCNVCGDIREVEIPVCGHEYDDVCDYDCNLCGEYREAPHNVIYVAAKDATCTETGNIEYWYCDVCGYAWLDAECTLNTNLQAVKLGATCANAAVAHEAIAAGCHYTGMAAYWYCANCDVFYADAACTIVTNYLNCVIPALGGDVVHFDAVDAGCHYNGNIEYWVCYECEQVWADEALTQLTNIKNVILPALQDSAEYVPAKDATCYENGNVEYWVCYECEQVWADEALTQLTNIKNVTIGMGHGEIIAVAAKDATCIELGNIAYWYCADCGQAWLDAECTLNTNLKAVVLPMGDHAYDDEFDADCNVCGDIRDVVAPVKEFSISYNGSGVSKDVSGLAFQFNVIASNLKIEGTNTFAGATIVIDGVEYKLVGLGATLTNGSEHVLDIPVQYLCDWTEDSLAFNVRVINIPEEYYDRDITATPYFIYEVDGEEITEDFNAIATRNYNEVLAASAE